MPSKKRRRSPDQPDDSTALMVHIEDIKAQNRLTIDAVHSVARALDQKFEERFQRLEQQNILFTAALRDVRSSLETKVDKVDGRLQVVETKVDNLELKVDRIDARLQVVETKVDNLEVKVDKIDVRLQLVETKVDRVDARLQGVEKTVESLVPLEARVSALERRPA
jgi:chromosome segregation ATPase